MNLTMDDVVEIYLDDLSRRGIVAKRPDDSLGDEWRTLINRVYPAPFGGDGQMS